MITKELTAQWLKLYDAEIDGVNDRVGFSSYKLKCLLDAAAAHSHASAVNQGLLMALKSCWDLGIDSALVPQVRAAIAAAEAHTGEEGMSYVKVPTT